MNNYSFLQRKLHQLALSSQLMRETAFDAEDLFTTTDESNDEHVFVSGLARSGTTTLLNALFKSEEFASLSYCDMPFVLAPNLWSRLSTNRGNNFELERAHGDGIRISIESPEAFEEVFWMTFDENDTKTKRKFERYVQLINNRYKKKKYLSKNNQNLKRLNLITEVFPNAKILIPFRDPIQHSNSLLIQHQRFIEFSKNDPFISKYMKWIGHTEFGPNYTPIHNRNLKFVNDLNINHWLEQWYLTYSNCLKSQTNKANVYFICYEQLCSSNKYWLDLLYQLGLTGNYYYEFRKSKTDVSIQIDKHIRNKALLLYSELLQNDFRNL